MAKLLGRHWKKSTKWKRGACIGRDYSSLKPGDIVGWGGNDEEGHVAVYVGEKDMIFIHCREPGATVVAIP